LVTPREGTVELSGPLVAEKVSSTGLTFEMMVVEDSVSGEIASTGKTYVEKKATGTVRLFNNNSTSPQKLLIDTRLTDSSGKIYKTKTATTIPGQKMVDGKLSAGFVDVEIYADESGESYNLAKDTELKIFGFKGGPKYNTIYAKTTSEISGGMKGESSNVTEDGLKAKTESLKLELTKSLIEKAKAQLPETFVFYEKASIVKFSEPLIESIDSEKATIKLEATMNAVVFKETEITKALVKNVVSKDDEKGVFVSNLRDLNIELDPTTTIGDPNSMSTIKIRINDKVNVVWNVDEDVIKESLAGIRKKDFDSKMIDFKNIDKAELHLKPFWKNKLPEKKDAIKIENTFSVNVN
jgi:hypothetical protein